jgi:vitamin B12 transporter
MFCVLAILLALGSSLGAQETAILLGSVRTVDGTPLPQIVILIEGPSGPRTVVTGPGGRFRVPSLAPGDYAFRAETPGFALSPASKSVTSGEVRVELTLAALPLREHVIVAATRGEAVLPDLGVSATVIGAQEIAERNAPSLIDLLGSVPGVATARSGGVGLQASAFVRGGESNFSRILIDGFPANEPGGFLNFGSLLPLELERIEVVRGAASSLYGTDALAGVIQIVTRRAGPDETPGVHAEAEAGSFSWKRGVVGTSGRVGPVDWNAGVERLETDNEEPNSAFRETAGALSFGAQISERSSLRFTARGETSTVGTPGPTLFERPDLDNSYEWKSLTFGVEFRNTSVKAAQSLRAGLALMDQLSLNPVDSGPYVPRFGDRVAPFQFTDTPDPQGFQNNTRRAFFAYQSEIKAGPQNLVTAGVDVEREAGSIGERAGTLLDPRRTNLGVFVQDRMVLSSRAFLTLGGRIERNDSFGTKAVPRVAVAWRFKESPDSATLHASAGAGIKEPNFFESFGVSFFAQGNPHLKPERSRTVDFGMEQRLLSGRMRADFTLYQHDYLDQIAFETVDAVTQQGTYVNLGKTRARGFEVSLEAVPTKHLELAAEYTYLDGTVLVSSSTFDPVYAQGQSLLRRPRHQGSISFRAGAGRVLVGGSLLLVGRRTDSDFVALGLTENPSYTRLDARASVQLGHGLEAFLAGDNVLDRKYMEVLGFPSLPRSLRGGLRFRSGRVSASGS